MSTARFWCFDDEALDRALSAMVERAAPGSHPEAKAAAESAAATVRSFLQSDEVRQYKMIQEVKLSGVSGR